MAKTDEESAAAEQSWDTLATHLIETEHDVERGRMMSADAVTCGGKVFAFRSSKTGTEGLGVRLGRDYDFASLPTQDWTHLAPFKAKPPMKDWVMVSDMDARHWPELAGIALTLMREKLGTGS
ncbi:MAG: hypothetical protein AAGF14_02070 [Pseudomonadota bacterium]